MKAKSWLLMSLAFGFTALGLTSNPRELSADSPKSVKIEALRGLITDVEKNLGELKEHLRLLEQGQEAEKPANETTVKKGLGFISFGDVVTNLKVESLNRYLRMKLVIRVEPSEEKECTVLVTNNRLLLQNWLLAHVADLTVADVSGKHGNTQLREDIQRAFNSILEPERKQGRIREILFEEFVVQ